MKNEVLKAILNKELKRQQESLNLIASENYVSEDILQATGSIFTNKYCEGYPNARYYGGCEYADEIETLAIEKAKEIFKCNFANVQPHSGTQANIAVYLGLLKPNDKILSMGLNEGGHLSHGFKISLSGKVYQIFNYGVDEKTQMIDYQNVFELAKQIKPQLILCGASNYSRTISFEKFGKIAKAVGAYLLADIAHIAGLVVTGYHPNPFPHADVVTTTTHKTLCGPRSGLILCNDEKIAKKINVAVFPGSQGGPLMHVIAAKYLCFAHAATPIFKQYIKDVILNTKQLAFALKNLGYHIVANDTDNHLLSVDVFKTLNITGDLAEKWLGLANIVINKNLIPHDINTSKTPSGIRLGAAALTTRGLKPNEFNLIAKWINQILSSKGNETVIKTVKQQVKQLMTLFPLYPNLKY